MSIIPNLFIIGAPKTGTTALANNISQHRDIFIPGNKEPKFFDAKTFYDFKDDHPFKTLDEYLALYEQTDSYKYRIDASVFNMYCANSIKNILTLSPDAKFMIIIRDPVESSVSMHHQRLKYLNPKMREISDDFMVCWNALALRKKGNGYPPGCRNKFLFRYDLLYSYENYLPMLQKLVRFDNLFIGFYEDYKNNPDHFYSKIFGFLNLPDQRVTNVKLNDSYYLQSSKLQNLANKLAQKTYRLRKKSNFLMCQSKRIKNILFKPRKKSSSYYQNVDEKVYAEFANTYNYISKLKNEITLQSTFSNHKNPNSKYQK